jgi:hypothetical protein
MHSAEFAVAPSRSGQYLRRFAVSWRNSTSGEIHPVGLLEADVDRDLFRFRYLTAAADIAGFRPFIGFPELDRRYESPRLWPFFALRAMEPRRPDFEDYVGRLGLTSHASVLDILARSGGETQGDTVSVVEEPLIGPTGSTEYVFLVRGARYATGQFNSAGVVDQLQQGDPLVLMADASNPVNPGALLVATASGPPIGWVPDLLVAYFQALAEGHVQLSVARNNGADAPWHLRLLVRAWGSVDPMFNPFDGPRWTTFVP